MKALGIDVGLIVCGYVLCQVEGLTIDLIKQGQIIPNPKHALPQKLNCIFDGLSEEIAQYNPEAIIVEKLYSHHRHPTTLGVLAQVRGVVGLLAYQKELGFFEYSSTRARKSFLGKGSANSEQVKKMAENVTGEKFKSIHVADAFSLVVAFSHAQKFKRILRDSV
ncbi:MAG: crossover junction endodeoxyribonuclease RuvC [Candidatus Omnitrophota bacterium]